MEKVQKAKLHYPTSVGGAAVHLAGGLGQLLPSLTRKMAVGRGCLGVKLHKRKSHTTEPDQRPSIDWGNCKNALKVLVFKFLMAVSLPPVLQTACMSP